jgi:hypothetical protein
MSAGSALATAARVITNIRAIRKSIPQQIAAALYIEAQIEATESKKRTPVDTGNLRASHMVTEPVINGDSISVQIVVGGVSAQYAVFVHENLEAFHEVGQAKFLESTLLESRPYMAARVAKRVSFKNE